MNKVDIDIEIGDAVVYNTLFYSADTIQKVGIGIVYDMKVITDYGPRKICLVSFFNNKTTAPTNRVIRPSDLTKIA